MKEISVKSVTKSGEAVDFDWESYRIFYPRRITLEKLFREIARSEWDT